MVFLSDRSTIPKTAIWWSFSFTDKANEIILLAISSGELTDWRSLVLLCTITRSGITHYFMNLVRAPWNGFTRINAITASFIYNRFSMQMFYYWIFNYNSARTFLCRTLGLLCSVISSRSDFLSSWSGGSLTSLLKFSLTWVLPLELLFTWLILSLFWSTSFSFVLVIMVQWLLLAVNVCIVYSF